MKTYIYKKRLLYRGTIGLPYVCYHCNGTGEREPEEDLFLPCYHCNGTGEQFEMLEHGLQELECYSCKLPFKHFPVSQSDPRFPFFPYDYTLQGKEVFFCSLVCWENFKQLREVEEEATRRRKEHKAAVEQQKNEMEEELFEGLNR